MEISVGIAGVAIRYFYAQVAQKERIGTSLVEKTASIVCEFEMTLNGFAADFWFYEVVFEGTRYGRIGQLFMATLSRLKDNYVGLGQLENIQKIALEMDSSMSLLRVGGCNTDPSK